MIVVMIILSAVMVVIGLVSIVLIIICEMEKIAETKVEAALEVISPDVIALIVFTMVMVRVAMVTAIIAIMSIAILKEVNGTNGSDNVVVVKTAKELELMIVVSTAVVLITAIVVTLVSKAMLVLTNRNDSSYDNISIKTTISVRAMAIVTIATMTGINIDSVPLITQALIRSTTITIIMVIASTVT